MKINKSSWHWELYKLNSVITRDKWPYDICEYTRGVLVSLFFIIPFVISVITVAVLSVGSLIFNLYGWIYVGNTNVLLPPFTALALVAVLVIISTLLVGYLDYLTKLISSSISKLSAKPTRVSNALSIKDMYRSWKEKYCVRIDIDED